MLGFAILTYCTSEDQLDMLRDNLACIQQFHPDAPIVIVDDGSKVALTNLPAAVRIVPSKYQGSAELAPYVFYHDNKFCEIMIMLHDSMLLKQPLDVERVESIQTLRLIWHFTNHRTDWSYFPEPRTPYNIEHAIWSHDDLIKHMVNTFLTDEKYADFHTYFNEIYDQKKQWVGCFGVMTLITHDFLRTLQARTGILDLAPHINDRRRRMVMESLFPIAAQFAQTPTHIPITTSFDNHRFQRGQMESNCFKKQSFARCSCTNCSQSQNPTWRCSK